MWVVCDVFFCYLILFGELLAYLFLALNFFLEISLRTCRRFHPFVAFPKIFPLCHVTVIHASICVQFVCIYLRCWTLSKVLLHSCTFLKNFFVDYFVYPADRFHFPPDPHFESSLSACPRFFALKSNAKYGALYNPFLNL